MGRCDGEVAWGVACKRCNAFVARHSQLAFLLENATAVHLTLIKSLLVDEQLKEKLQTQLQDTGERWRVYSREHIQPKLQFTKVRTTNAYKRDRLPFELCCVNCQAKVGSEGFLDELAESVLLLDSRSCACVLDKQTPYGGLTGRKWGVILPQLLQLQLPHRIQKLQDLIEGDGVIEIQEEPEPVEPVVLPTIASIRSHFNPTGRMSRLRRYQVELTLSALLENTIVYLPTGNGHLHFAQLNTC
ncbi:Interferon-induced helicase C domain-containing protein 1 [Phytophthora boehmeriae]|uniref:Interferon-induced helicase C domain-containing protein 1 n=1 Tax=Phytophthora boehmeriae TaxID=109152 RepID=A0A8T1X5L8_9STRA|nr:Interferon-induced helicase C domain-containing protein 1 [Phytophthora boehmeriae]